MKKEKCMWMYNIDYDFWTTGCEEALQLIEGTPYDNKMKYCPYCGKKIKVTKDEWLLQILYWK